MDAILTFHSIDASGSVLSYPAGDLQRLLEGLLEEGVEIVGLDALLERDPARGPRVALTFDDGFSSVHREARPLLERLGVPATLYIVTDWMGRDNRWPTQPAAAPQFEIMSWEQLAELPAAGFEIGCHTASHPRLDRIPDTDWDLELEQSRSAIEDRLGTPVRHFAYPYGDYSDETVERVERLFDTAVTADMGYLRRGDRPHLLPRLDAYYLRQPKRHQLLFGLRTRCYLSLRARLRNLRSRLVR